MPANSRYNTLLCVFPTVCAEMGKIWCNSNVIDHVNSLQNRGNVRIAEVGWPCVILVPPILGADVSVDLSADTLERSRTVRVVSGQFLNEFLRYRPDAYMGAYLLKRRIQLCVILVLPVLGADAGVD